MVLEDLHWADDSVVEFLDHLTEWATDSPILVVATARPELFTDRPDWGAGKRDAVTAGLTPLSNEDAVALMSALADRPVMSADLQQTLLEHSGGNPLYVTEYVRLAVEEDWFSKSDRGETLPLPDSIQSIISARIDLLPTEDKTLLQTAAVVGRVFWTAALSFADAGSPDDVRAGLRRLIRREMIRPVRRSSMQGHDEYTFGHVLIRDVAYGRLTRDERARLHGATARWLEAISGEGASDVAELIAHHLSTSYDLSPDKDPEMRRRIFRFLMLAVERAGAIDAPAAHRLAERALEYTSDDRERGKALLEVAIRAYRADDATINAFRGAIEAFQQVGDIEGEIKATSRLSNTYWYMGEGSIVDELDEQILELLDGRPPSDVVADATVALASKSQLRGNEDEAMDLVERGLALAQQVGDTKTYARALVIRGSSLVQLGDTAGLEDIEAGLAIQLDLNEAPSAISTYNNLATFLNDSGETVRAETLINQAITLGEQRGLVSHVDFSHMTLIEVLSQLGEWDRVLELVDERAGLERLRGTQVQNGLRIMSCPILHYRGQSQRAWEIATATMPGIRETKDPQGLVPTLLNSIYIANGVGDGKAARSLALELIEVSADHPIFLGLHLPSTAHGYVELGMIDELEILNRRAFRGIEWFATRLRRVDALLAAHAGEHDRSLELLDPLIAEADERSQVLLATFARVDAAESAMAVGDHERALSLLDAAEPAAKRMKATRFLSAIDILRATTTSAAG
jgi:tetratricopeptide (TPR) repeat protein